MDRPEGVLERAHPVVQVALDAALAQREVVGDLAHGHVLVEPQHDARALPRGERAERLEHVHAVRHERLGARAVVVGHRGQVPDRRPVLAAAEAVEVGREDRALDVRLGGAHLLGAEAPRERLDERVLHEVLGLRRVPAQQERVAHERVPAFADELVEQRLPAGHRSSSCRAPMVGCLLPTVTNDPRERLGSSLVVKISTVDSPRIPGARAGSFVPRPTRSGRTHTRQGGRMLTLGTTSLVIVGAIAVIAALALVFAVALRRQVLAAGEGTASMQDIAKAIQEGAQAYLNRQFRTLLLFAVVVFALLFLLPGDGGVKLGRSIFFLLGAGFSAAIGYLGMWLATRANLRVAAAASKEGGRAEGARIAFRTGGVVGMSVVGLGLVGAAAVVLVYRGDAPAVLEGFGFGAALLAMFMRVGGGIFTKAADVGADLVGKVEQGIPEDDPRNAATIADNVGDNVGDCAGMAADLFESYAVMLVASLILGKAVFGEQGLIFPLIVTAVGALVAVLGVAITKVRAGESGLTAIYRGFYISALVGALLAAAAAFLYLPSTFADIEGVSAELRDAAGDPRLVTSGAVVIGVVLAGVILAVTGYFTGTTSKPTLHVARTSQTGAATVVLSGIGVGFESAVYTAGIIAAAICGAFLLAGGSVWLSVFLVALAGCGLLTTVGVIVAMDTFGPVSDNAQGIAEMSGEVDAEGAQILTDLDAAGNTTKAITKGIAIATAVLAAPALFGPYADAVRQALASVGEWAQDDGITIAMLSYEIFSPITLVGVILGAATVFLFS